MLIDLIQKRMEKEENNKKNDNVGIDFKDKVEIIEKSGDIKND